MEIKYQQEEKFVDFQIQKYEINEKNEKVYGFSVDHHYQLALLTSKLEFFNINTKEKGSTDLIQGSTRLEYYNNGKNLAVIEDLGWIRLYDIQKNEIIQSFQVEDVSVNHSSWAFEITKDNVLLCGGNHHSMMAVDLNNSVLLYHWKKIHQERIMDISVNDDYFLTCSWDKTVKKISLIDYQTFDTYKFDEEINSVVYLNQDEFLLGFNTGEISLHSFDGSVKRTIVKDTAPIFHIRYLKDFMIYSHWKGSMEKVVVVSHPSFGNMELHFGSRIWDFKVYGKKLMIVDDTDKTTLFVLNFYDNFNMKSPRFTKFENLHFYFNN